MAKNTREDLKEARIDSMRGEDDEIVECPHCHKVNMSKSFEGGFLDSHHELGELVICDKCGEPFAAKRKEYLKNPG